MTEISIYSENGDIQILSSGHSGYTKELGKDIVCSGISTLLYSFAELCYELSDENKVIVNSVTAEEGYMEISVTDRNGNLKYPLKMLNCGLTAIADKYPKNLFVRWGEKIF